MTFIMLCEEVMIHFLFVLVVMYKMASDTKRSENRTGRVEIRTKTPITPKARVRSNRRKSTVAMTAA